MKSPTSIIITVVAIAVGVVVLLGYFLSIGPLPALRTIFVGWAVILAALATLVGVVNLLSVHINRINNGESGYGYSLILLTFFLLTLVLGLARYFIGVDFLPQAVSAVQVPVEASLMAILTVVLALAAIRLLRRRRTFFSVVFFISALVFLTLGSGLFSSLLPGFPAIQALVGALNRLPVAGARGILLGVALGSLATGLRILMGADRPYGS